MPWDWPITDVFPAHDMQSLIQKRQQGVISNRYVLNLQESLVILPRGSLAIQPHPNLAFMRRGTRWLCRHYAVSARAPKYCYRAGEKPNLMDPFPHSFSKVFAKFHFFSFLESLEGFQTFTFTPRIWNH